MFFRWFVGSLVPSFILWFACSFVGIFARHSFFHSSWFARLFVLSFVLSCGSLVGVLVGWLVPSLVLSCGSLVGVGWCLGWFVRSFVVRSFVLSCGSLVVVGWCLGWLVGWFDYLFYFSTLISLHCQVIFLDQWRRPFSSLTCYPFLDQCLL